MAGCGSVRDDGACGDGLLADTTSCIIDVKVDVKKHNILWYVETYILAKLSAKKPVNKGNLRGMGFCQIVNTVHVETVCLLERKGR